MTQPHLSRAIARLEAELGVQLFLRTSRKVRLTTAGEVFHAEALELVQGQQRAVLLARAAGSERSQVLRIGFVSAALHRLLPALLRELRAADGDLHTELRELATQDQIALLTGGEIDLGLGHPPVMPHDRIVSEVLGSDRFDALLPADHRLANQASVTFADLAADPFVLFPETQGPALYAAIRDQCRLAGQCLIVAHTASRLHSQCSFIAAGLGVGLAPIQSRSLQMQGTVRLPIKPYPASLQLPLAIFWDKRQRSILRDDCLRKLRQLAKVAADIA
ncbi:transcriptional regulator, LysR family [plant metagenome]